LVIQRLFELKEYNVDYDDDDLRIKKVKQYINKHYAENIPVKKLADMIGLNDIYFNAQFKRKTGITLHQFLIETRIRNAEEMLRNGECNVGEAAERCGYSDVVHFSRQFKALMGFPPSFCLPKWGY
jgi:AraC-like DNA-binding protein